ncbi:DUF2029 domain-containing protein [Henriciella barbarensis]|uniref:DUF2029 domain-containing protein n=1 Tax=Henriciella barbarensis TaxID=86342 RepID=A0A399R0N0_9PROT|nr:DUF2029 domain-containing protein [Henriciella barbarensis]
MTDLPASEISWRWWAVWLACFGAFSMMVPRDASFDVAHYHLYNGWAALNGRDGHDLAPAEMHSFASPGWQVFIWLLIEWLPGRAVAFLLGILQGLGLPALYALSRRVLARTGAKPSLLLVLSIAVAGFLAEAQFGLFGSLRNDAVFTVVFFASLVLLFPRLDERLNWKRLAAASGLLGLCIGLKLTNAVYALFFATTALILMQGWRERISGTLVCAVFALIGIALTGGSSAFYLYETYGNPIFPLLNGVFDSPLGPEEAFRDTRYLPNGFFGALIRPFAFLFDGEMINEHDFFDPRLQLGYLASLALLIPAFAWRRVNTKPGVREACALAGGFIVMVIGWTFVFSIARYIIAAWMIGPLMAVLLIALWRPGWLAGSRAALVGLACAVGLSVMTQPSLLRRAPWPANWSAPYVAAELPDEDAYSNAVIAFAGGYPGAFLSPFFPESARLTHLVPQDWSAPALEGYRSRIRELVRDPYTELYVVITETAEGSFSETVRRLEQIENIAVNTQSCARIRSSFDTPGVYWKICPATWQGILYPTRSFSWSTRSVFSHEKPPSESGLRPKWP